MPPTRRRRKPAPERTAVAYLRCSTSEQALRGVSIEVQRAEIAAWAAAKGVAVVAEFADEGVSGGKGIDERPGLAAAVEMVSSRQAETLVSARMDRLSRALIDTAELIRRAEKEGWSLAFCDMNIDMGDPTGRYLAHNLASANEHMRGIIGTRTRAALALKREQGIRLGRPSNLPQPVIDQIAAWRRGGWTFQQIADALNGQRVPTSRGGACWRPSSVRAVAVSQDALPEDKRPRRPVREEPAA
jgi:DNA invertase Pin-like site-specific DNA recombinase